MANADAAFGLRPAKSISGSPQNFRVTEYQVLASDATPLGIGDPVVRVAAGSVALANGGAIPICTRAAAGSGTITGVVVGIQKIDENNEDLSVVTRPASTKMNVLVADDPDTVFEIQEDGNAGVTAVGQTADLATISNADTTTGRSKVELDSSDIGTGAQLKVIGFKNSPDNDPTLANSIMLVVINEHTDRATTTAI